METYKTGKAVRKQINFSEDDLNELLEARTMTET